MNKRSFSLDDKYTVKEGRIALTGVQALVRLPMDQHRRDVEAGIRTGTYVSGYQGSPLGELDKQMRLAQRLLQSHQVIFEPGLNEDIAATAVYGTQFLDMFPHETFDGVLGMWYGKGPGIDRTGDAFRHANYLGTTRYGAALALGGDDPASKSSTVPSDSVVAFYDVLFPVLYPGNPAEVLEFGLHGFAMSRYSGLWSALKIVTNVADGGATVEVHPDLARPQVPELMIGDKPFEKQQDFRFIPPHNVEIERILYYERMAAVQAYARANKLDVITVRSPSDRLGFIAAGKSYADLREALDILGLGESQLREAGIRIYKLGMIAPLEPEGLKAFAEGLEEIVMVEEKRGFTEMLVRDALYNHSVHPAVYGKLDGRGQPFFPSNGELEVGQIARILAGYLAEKLNRPDLLERVKMLVEIDERPLEPTLPRVPYFCSGCPHNTSTTLPPGELAGGGIGCHAMALYMDRGVVWLTHMGGEGAPWIGVSNFVDREHLFQNVGDGTYFHSASKSVDACIASGVNITFKLLYNAAVAMTGGQTAVGARGPVDTARQLVSSGAKQVVIVPEDQSRYPQKQPAPGITVRAKDDYNQVMLELRKVKGVSIIIFDQQCAAEKRRERKRNIQPTPRKRVYINPSVCEGCGDCGVKSNCLSVVPVQTEYGRKTAINQSSCNMDYSCLKGDCPSFMTIELSPDAKPLKKQGVATDLELVLPEPAQKVSSAAPYKVLMVGIGGTGVVTVDALLLTAALLEGKHATHLDQTGLAQKGGAVVSNLTLSDQPFSQGNLIPPGETDLLIAFDLLASVMPNNLRRCHPQRTVVVANSAKFATAEEITNIHALAPSQQVLMDKLHAVSCKERNVVIDSERVVAELFGDQINTNIFMVGVAYQSGLLPLAAESIEEAIAINGVAVAENVQAFRWGRRLVYDPAAVQALIDTNTQPLPPREAALEKLRSLAPKQVGPYERLLETFSECFKGEALAAILLPRVADLILYQNAAYARSYLEFVRFIGAEERTRTPGKSSLTEAVARWLFKLMGYKDEYEVARLWLQDGSRKQPATEYEGSFKAYYHLHPPLLRAMGVNKKLRLGGWFTPLLGLLARLKWMRGTALDVFGLPAIRREERRLIGWYRELIESLLPRLSYDNHPLALEIAALPDSIRGYEEVKLRMIAEAEAEVARLLGLYQHDAQPRQVG